jgi:hypothetical protein
MIDIVAEIKKGNKELEQKVAAYLLERRDTYYTSSCFNKLKGRYNRLSASIDMNYGKTGDRGKSGNSFTSKLVFPMVREMYLMWRAMLKRNFRQNPLITLEPMDSTPLQTAVNMQDVLTLNLKSTQFRESRSGWDAICDDGARFGAAVCLSQFEHRTPQVLKTSNTPFGPQQIPVTKNRKNVFNYRIHLLNYGQDPMVSDPANSSWKSIVENVPISKLISEAKANPENYLMSNLQSILKDAKAQAYKDQYMHREGDDKSLNDYAKTGLDRVKFWAKIHLNGNEDDDGKFYVEMIGDKMIRIQRNWIDEDEDQISVFTLRNRSEYWWGNAPCEDIVPHENFVHLMMNMKAEQALKLIERYIFYARGSIDPTDIDNRHVSGGFIPVDLKNFQMQNMLYEYQGKDSSTSDIDYMMREIKESAQKMSPKPDFLRSGNKGGLANNTATAAGILNEMGDLLESDCMEVFATGLQRMGRLNVLQLQQFLANQIQIRPNPKLDPVMLWKSEILGDFWYHIVSSLHKNTVQEAIRLQNAITQMQNFKGTGDPTWQNVNMVPVVRKWVGMLDIGDVDEIMPQQAQMMAQQMPSQGMMPQGMPVQNQPEEMGVANVA